MGRVKWDAPGELHQIIEPLSERAQSMRTLLPSVKVAEGRVVDLIAHVLAQPPLEQWRYAIASDWMPYLRGEEITALAREPDFPRAAA